MEQIVVAFERDADCQRICTVLERSGAFACLPCHSAGQVRRLLTTRQLGVVVCGYKLADATAEELCADLPASVRMLLLATRDQLELCRGEALFRLAIPASRGELLTCVTMLAQAGRGGGRPAVPRRSGEEEQLLREAKALLMARRGMTEEQAHRLLQKRSMDAGWKMTQTARLVLEELGQPGP